MMTTPLAIQYPLAYRDVFEPLTDFEVWDKALWPILGIKLVAKDIWVDNSKTGYVDTYVGTQGIIVPTQDCLIRHYPKIGTRLKIAIWDIDKAYLPLFEEAFDIVAIPWWKRGRLHGLENTEKYHLYEFCSLDELRRYRVRSLHTSVPITAAVAGIDLSTRERRPKKLPAFSYDLKLTDAQIKLAVKNIEHIREALNSHGG